MSRKDKGLGASASRPGSREPSPDGLGPTGFDPSRVTAFRVEVSVYSSIVGHMIGWQRAADEDRTFGRRDSAERYAKERTGIISILVPYMFWRSRVVEVSMPADWRSPEQRHLDIMTFGFGLILAAVIAAAVFL